MDIDDNGDFRRRLVLLAELFDVKLSAARQALYFEALRDLPFEGVASALNQAAKGCTFFPKPAELRQLACGDAEDQAELAWMAFRRAMTAAGSYASLVVADPALGEAILAMFGSWPAACATELSPEMWASKRKEFGRVYRVLVQRPLVGARYLPGICEQQNAGREDWRRHIPVAALAGGDVTPLSPQEAEQAKASISAQSHGFTRITSEIIAGLIPRQMDDTA